MSNHPLIIGVKHLPDQIESVEEALKSLVQKGDRIGLESSPEDVALYAESLQVKYYPIDDLYEKVKVRDRLHNFPIYDLIEIRGFHEFYMSMYGFLLELGAVPIGVGSRVRDNVNFDYTRRVFLDHGDVDKQFYLSLNLIAKPHFDHYVAGKIRDEALNGIIVGCDHQPISRIVGGNYIDLSGRSEEWAILCEQRNEILHSIYSAHKEMLPQL